MDLGLKGLHVLLTGSAGGIGAVTAEKYLEHGANISLHYHNQYDTLTPLLEKYPNNTLLVQGDATNEEDVIRCFAEANEKFGVCHIVVINHGIYEDTNTPIHKMSLSQWNNTININLTGCFLFAREFVRQLEKYASSMSDEEKAKFYAGVVIVGSTAGKFGESGHIDYSTSKSGIMYGFTYSLKNEIVKIFPRATVNVVAPGWVLTPMALEGIAKGEHYKAVRTIPLGKIASVEDVANMILICASPVTCNHMSGSIVMIDGGMEGRVQWDIEEIKQREQKKKERDT